MKGGAEVQYANSDYLFKRMRLEPRQNKVALVLGAGAGFQAIPLAQMGYKVVALDFSSTLLRELKKAATGLDIEIIHCDIMDFNRYADYNPELVVCVSDTLTHLPKAHDVIDLVEFLYPHMLPGGKLLLNFRDYAFERKDEHRFMLVRQNDETIFTCFLEYEDFRVKVFDIIYTREGGEWKQRISWYRKIRLATEFVRKSLKDAGFAVPEAIALVDEWATILAEKPNT
jgi:protein-L-isoaspartate O-methyltransferase